MGETLEYQTSGLSRRDFLRTGVVAGAAYTAGMPVLAQDNDPLAKYLQKIERQAIPIAAELNHGEAKIKETYDLLYSKNDADSRQQLVDKLISDSEGEANPVYKYVMLREARDESAKIKDFSSTFDAVKGLFDTYELPLDKAMNSVVSKVPKRGLTKDDIASLVDFHIQIVDYGLDNNPRLNANQYDTILSAAKYASSKARLLRDKQTSTLTSKLVKQIPVLKKEFVMFTEAGQKLANAPDDKKYNGVVGEYLCFVKNDWENGLPFLKKSEDLGLKILAGMELDRPDTVKDQHNIGNRWSALARKERKDSVQQERFNSRAKSWYETALTKATGIEKRDLEKKIASMEPAITARGIGIDLIRMIDPKLDNSSGEWSRKGKIISTSRTTGCLKIPYMPPEEYNINMTVTPKDGIDSVVFGLMKGNTNFVAWINNTLPPNHYTGIQMVDGNAMTANKTTYKGKLLKANKASNITYSVRKNSVSILVDGKVVSKYEESQGPLGSIKVLAPSSYNGLYVAVFDTSMDIQKLTLTPISGGKGKKSR